MQNKLISSKDIVAKYNISYPSLTHYTNIGLLTVVGRKGNKRLYNETEVKDRLVKISRLINEGYSLHLIRKKLIGV